MSSLKERLKRIGSKREQAMGDSPGEPAPYGVPVGHMASDGDADGDNPALPSFSRLADTEAGTFILRERRYPLSHEHGIYAFGNLIGRHGRLNRVSRRHAGMVPVSSHRGLLFFDTETTGLGVGAGNVPFMLGLGFYEENEFVVQQLFVRDPGEELAMLHYFGELAGRFTHLVTYNGKSFDWPVLANRYVMHRIPFDAGRLEHLDLLYIARNLWRNSLESCRLSRVEEERLGIRRSEDVPGSLAPVIYFQYLSDGDFGPMEGVFRHNEWDVMTLAILAAHLGAVLSGTADWGKLEAEDLYRTGKWLLESGLPDLAEQPFAALLERPEEAAGYAAPLAMAYKKMRMYDRAVPLWEQAARQSLAGARLAVTGKMIEPLIELAMYHEHHGKNWREALRWTDAALEVTERLVTLHARFRREADKTRQLQEELLHRRNRLLSKMGAGRGTVRDGRDGSRETGASPGEMADMHPTGPGGAEQDREQLEWSL